MSRFFEKNLTDNRYLQLQDDYLAHNIKEVSEVLRYTFSDKRISTLCGFANNEKYEHFPSGNHEKLEEIVIDILTTINGVTRKVLKNYEKCVEIEGYVP